MSKKHFIQVAEAIRFYVETGRKVDLTKSNRPIKAANFHRGSEHAAQVIASNLAFIFEQANPRFDRSKFLEACNVNH